MKESSLLCHCILTVRMNEWVHWSALHVLIEWKFSNRPPVCHLPILLVLLYTSPLHIKICNYEGDSHCPNLVLFSRLKPVAIFFFFFQPSINFSLLSWIIFLYVLTTQTFDHCAYISSIVICFQLTKYIEWENFPTVPFERSWSLDWLLSSWNCHRWITLSPCWTNWYLIHLWPAWSGGKPIHIPSEVTSLRWTRD